ncbi:hypothetical protein CJ030_MR7G000061 [Morella rubra]|uniref:Uncharacterized protein n=1 Tax=Morella rubra TaxID=262757 RepID=A0A6A1V1F9_9ROSI|nr:hypothetical protein CJ030_MR7G000061 [Morella rubra]
MRYRKNSRNKWVPKRQASDKDEDEEMLYDDDNEVDAKAIKFDVDANMADDPLIIPSPTIVLNPTSSFDTRFTVFEERLTNMHEGQKKFLEKRFTSMQEKLRKFFEEMRTFMARFPPP